MHLEEKKVIIYIKDHYLDHFLAELKSEIVFLLRSPTKMKTFGLLDPLDNVELLLMYPLDPKAYVDPVKDLKKTGKRLGQYCHQFILYVKQ